jgi:hybrid cluster-associated redox disulfide protein
VRRNGAQVMIHKDMLILEILQKYPQTKKVFDRYSMPCDRCMGAVRGSLADGARMHGLPLNRLMQELEECIITEANLRAESRPTEGCEG